MAYTGSTLLSLPVITTGSESGKWGDITNNGLTQYLDISIAGALSITSSATLANTSGSDTATNIGATTAQYRTIIVPASGPAANIVITAPSSNRTYHVVNRNATYTVQIRAGTNSGVTFGVNQSGTVTYDSVAADYVLVGPIGPTLSPGGSTTQVQYNNAGAFAGSANFVFDGTNVGIGATSPADRLDVRQAGVAARFTSTNGNVNQIALSNSATAVVGFYMGSSAANVLQFSDSTGAERMRIDSSGNVGIGLTPVANNGILQLNSYGAIKALIEGATVSATQATGTIDYDAATQAVLYYTGTALANWTVNFRGSGSLSLNSMMQTGQSLTLAFLVTQGATAYYNSAVQVDGSSVTPKWQGGTAPTLGNASSIDVYSYTIIKTGASTFTVLASQTKFA